ncbi:hypothetical protein BY996DRAFT_6592561 [Phakopsora pachyrhizi]|nr:hypothetical protein BY996DRAFT_6592561 [Phakopsora pachyrhizi]
MRTPFTCGSQSSPTAAIIRRAELDARWRENGLDSCCRLWRYGLGLLTNSLAPVSNRNRPSFTVFSMCTETSLLLGWLCIKPWEIDNGLCWLCIKPWEIDKGVDDGAVIGHEFDIVDLHDSEKQRCGFVMVQDTFDVLVEKVREAMDHLERNLQTVFTRSAIRTNRMRSLKIVIWSEQLGQLDKTEGRPKLDWLISRQSKTKSRLTKTLEVWSFEEDLKGLTVKETVESESKGGMNKQLAHIKASATTKRVTYNEPLAKVVGVVDEYSQALEYSWWFVEGDLSHLKLLTEQVKFLGLPIEVWVWLTSVWTPHMRMRVIEEAQHKELIGITGSSNGNTTRKNLRSTVNQMKKELQRFMSQCQCLDMTVLIDVKLEDPLIKDKKVSLLGGVICGQKISMGSDIGPPPSPHSLIDQDFSPITTHSQDWMDVNNGFFEVRQYARPCAFCTRNNLVCCEATRPGSKKCEACWVVKGVCVFNETPVFSEGRKVWCNPTTKSYGFEHPIQDVPTDNFDSGVRSVLKKAGIPTGGIPILSKGWVNHKGVERNQVGSSERLARSQLRRAKEAKANQPAKRQKRNPSKSVKKTQANLNTVANGSSSKEDGDDEGNDEDEGIDKRGNTAETEDGEYRPPLDNTAPPSPRPTRRQPNPSRGKSSIPTAGKNPVNQLTSLLRAPPAKSLKSTLPRVVVRRSLTANLRAVDPVNRGVTPGVDDLVPWIPEGSELELDGFTRDRRTAMGLLVETHYLLGQGIQELIRGNPGKRFMGLAAVSDQMELAMTRVIREMGGWFEHLESNGFVSYEAWDGSAGEGPAESDPAE